VVQIDFKVLVEYPFFMVKF